MKTKRVEFAIPEGYTVPEGTEPGEEFDVVCSIRVKPNGTLCLTKLGDVEMPGYKDKENDGDADERPNYGKTKQMMTGGEMPGMGET